MVFIMNICNALEKYFSILLLILLPGCNTTQPSPYVVVSADDRATQAGIQILKQGGNAVDAAIAIQSVLSLVEPQSSGLGGGAFMMYYDAKHQQLHAFDGREVAPANIKPQDFINARGEPKGYFDTAFGGQSVGVPGVVALLGKAHAQFGNLDWHDLFGRAQSLATNGFSVSPRLSQWLKIFPHNQADPKMLHYFYDSAGNARPVGYRLKNPAYAKTLQTLANEGAHSFYTGSIAKQISHAVANAQVMPRTISTEDLAHYKAKEREPLCKLYHQYKVCSIGPPSSGGVFLLQTLGILEGFNLQQYTPFSPQALHLIIEASRLSFADRQQYIADPDFVSVPVKGLLHTPYLNHRASLININRAADSFQAGDPSSWVTSPKNQTVYSPHIGKEYPSTSHFSIMDAEGNVVSLTTTVQGPFGSFLSAGGFILNNQLTDFSYLASNNDKSIANAIAPGKRPRSSMTPTIVFDQNNQVKLVIGSPGGGRIFSYVLKTVLGVLDWDMTVQTAIDAANLSLPKGLIEFEENRFDSSTLQRLKNMGHPISKSKQTSGLNGFEQTQHGIRGGADTRREGTYNIQQ